MKEKMSSAIFENLNPSDEQRKKMFDRIIDEDAKIESEEISVRYVEENRFSLKNIIYPAAAAVIMICVIASALPFLRNMDKQMAAENESLLTDEAGISAEYKYEFEQSDPSADISTSVLASSSQMTNFTSLLLSFHA